MASPRLLIRIFEAVAVIAIAIGLVALGASWDAGRDVVVPAVVVGLAVAVLMLARSVRLARERGNAELERVRGQGEEHLRSLLDRAHEAYVVMGQDGRVQAWNSAAETMFGWRRKEAIGRPLAELVIPEDMRGAHVAGIERFIETGKGPVVGPRRS